MVSLTVYSVIDILIKTAYILKLLYSWLFIGPAEHHHTTDIKVQFFLIKWSLHNVKQCEVVLW